MVIRVRTWPFWSSFGGFRKRIYQTIENERFFQDRAVYREVLRIIVGESREDTSSGTLDRSNFIQDQKAAKPAKALEK